MAKILVSEALTLVPVKKTALYGDIKRACYRLKRTVEVEKL